MDNITNTMTDKLHFIVKIQCYLYATWKTKYQIYSNCIIGGILIYVNHEDDDDFCRRFDLIVDWIVHKHSNFIK